MNTYRPRGSEPHPRSKTTTAMQLVNRLIAAGADVNAQLNFHRPGRGGNSQRFVDDLLTTGASVLLRAAIVHDNEAMKALLAAGAEVDLPNVMGVTPLMAAAAGGKADSDLSRLAVTNSSDLVRARARAPPPAAKSARRP